MILKETLKKHFINFNGGQGLDHWSPSSSQNFTRLVCNYSLPQKLRRTFKIRYKAPFGNLVNNPLDDVSDRIEGWHVDHNALRPRAA